MCFCILEVFKYLGRSGTSKMFFIFVTFTDIRNRHFVHLIQSLVFFLNLKAGLENDYKISQELLEARENEISQLTEEMVDSVAPAPLQTDTLYLHQQVKSFHIHKVDF